MNRYRWRLKQPFLQHANTDRNIKISKHRYGPQNTQGVMFPSFRKAMETAVTLLTKFKAPHLLGCPLLVAIIPSFLQDCSKSASSSISSSFQNVQQLLSTMTHYVLVTTRLQFPQHLLGFGALPAAWRWVQICYFILKLSWELKARGTISESCNSSSSPCLEVTENRLF